MCCLETSIIRVLLVEDYEPFRVFVRSVLQNKPGFEITSEASDGLEAVQNAGELKPDLVILDIGLPTVNGIEAARRILRILPACKILFLTQESSAVMVQEALSFGPLGYVVKVRAAADLPRAIETVCQGRRFVSQGLSEHDLDTPMNTAPADILRPQPRVSLAPENEVTRRHDVAFYSDNASLVTGLTRFILDALKIGKPVILIATEPHRKGVLLQLLACGVDLASAMEQGLFRALDSEETLARFMVNDLPDPAQFRKVASDLFATAAKAAQTEGLGVAACGECAPVLWQQGKADAAIQVERLWDDVARSSNVDTLCTYVTENLPCEPDPHVYSKICAQHTAVLYC